MKLRRVISAAAALAVVAATTVSSFAASVAKGTDPNSGMFACLLSDDSNVPLFTDSSLVSTITSVSVTLKTKDKDFEKAVQAGDTWYGGGFGVNSNSTGWSSHEWSIQDGVKELTMVPTDTRYVYKITFDNKAPIFSSSDTYAQVWWQDWSSSAEFEFVSCELLNADGVDVRDLKSDAPAETEKPADTTAPEETTAPAEDETPAETVEATAEDEYTEEAYTDEVDTTVETTVESTTADADTADAEAPADDTNADAGKGNPDTGVAGVAVAAGVVALAGAAVVVSRKRK